MDWQFRLASPAFHVRGRQWLQDNILVTEGGLTLFQKPDFFLSGQVYLKLVQIIYFFRAPSSCFIIRSLATRTYSGFSRRVLREDHSCAFFSRPSSSMPGCSARI